MLNIEDMLLCKPGGSFRVEIATSGRAVITVGRPGEPQERSLCVSPGHANQARMQLTDEGLTGYVSAAR
jgi:hypothetical protein